MAMKKGDLVTWRPGAWHQFGITDTSDIVGTIIEGPTMFGFIERVYVLWNKYPKSDWSHAGEGLMRWVDIMDVKVISEGR